jgi:hypothetical protein
MLADDKSLTVYCSFRMEKIFMCVLPRVKETSERENPPPPKPVSEPNFSRLISQVDRIRWKPADFKNPDPAGSASFFNCGSLHEE